MIGVQACEDFVTLEQPRTDMIRETVFDNEKAANSAVIDIYGDMMFSGFACGNGANSFALAGAFSGDDWANHVGPASSNQEFSDNELNPRNQLIGTLWADLYRYIYKANAVIEGLSQSKQVTGALKDQLIGEAKFVRAFSHFYLVNLWGDVPLVLSTDYQVNRAISRTPVADVYDQIIADLSDAIDLLPDTYAHAKNQRVRPNRWAATALLARTHLFLGKWEEAEKAATDVINATALYELEALENVFSTASKEAIWQLHSTTTPRDVSAFLIINAPNHGALRPGLVQSFNPSDLRLANWVGSTTGPTTWYFVTKYKSGSAVTEYSTVMRLSEVFLIRAEARAQQNKVEEAVADINAIRARAGLEDIQLTTKDDVIDAVLLEKRLEFFCEWGHRWLDLKRTGKASEILAAIKPQTWNDTDLLYPIPEAELLRNPSMVGRQNPGYY